MTLIEGLSRRFSKRLPPKEIQKTFPDTVLRSMEVNPLTRKEQRTGLPFDINVTDGGFTLTRLGPPFSEEQGIRVFIIDNESLDRLYAAASKSDKLTPATFYRFLKMYERKNGEPGRHLALEKNGVVNLSRERMNSGYTIIVKKVDHPTKEKFLIPDEIRLKFKPPEGFEPKLTERILPWFKGMPLDLTMATRDAESLNIKEPYEQPGLRDFLQRGGYRDSELTKIFERKDQENGMFSPNQNTLIIKALRENMGSVPSAPIDISIKKDARGVLVARLTRKSGVDGVSVNGKMSYCYDDMDYIEVPLLPDGKQSTVKFWYGAYGYSKLMRKALELSLDTKNGHVIADYVSGVAEVAIEEYNPSAGLVMASLSEDQKKSLARIREVRAREEERRKILKQQAEIGTNVSIFSYQADVVEAVGNNSSRAYQAGDEEKLRAIIHDLTGR